MIWCAVLGAGLLATACSSDSGVADAGPATLDGSAVVDASSGPRPDLRTPPLMCPDVTAPTTCPTPMPRYADVAPIFQNNCVTCHAGKPNGPWPLTDYQHVSDWRDDIRSDLLTCSMPPPESGMTLSVDDRLAILTWIRCGLPK